jgi:DNA replication initiation complex subunit (GINS family)
MGDSVITFESIFDLVRKEKGNDVLQPLPQEIYEQIVNYLKTKIKQYEDAKTQGVAAAELEKIKTQIVSARKLIKELYERRERKILLLATDRSRTGSALPDEKSLLDEEKRMFDQACEILDSYRKGILLKLVNAKMPFSGNDPPAAAAPSLQQHEPRMHQEAMHEAKIAQSIKTDQPNASANEDAPSAAKAEYKLPDGIVSVEPEELSLIRFTGFVPKFLGKKMELFGPYEPGDMANLDKDIAEILIKRGRAEEVKT